MHFISLVKFTPYASIHSMDDAVLLFAGIDQLMHQFINKYEEEKQFSFLLNDKMQTVAAIALFTHVIKHEFHHKGQILSISKNWGYVPVDTDIIR